MTSRASRIRRLHASTRGIREHRWLSCQSPEARRSSACRRNCIDRSPVPTPSRFGRPLKRNPPTTSSTCGGARGGHAGSAPVQIRPIACFCNCRSLGMSQKIMTLARWSSSPLVSLVVESSKEAGAFCIFAYSRLLWSPILRPILPSAYSCWLRCCTEPSDARCLAQAQPRRF